MNFNVLSFLLTKQIDNVTCYQQINYSIFLTNFTKLAIIVLRNAINSLF